MGKDIEFFRKEYAKQKKLEKFVNTRQLVRPNVKKWQVAISFAILSFLIFAAIFLPTLTPWGVLSKIALSAALVLIIFESQLRLCLILVVKYYQKCAKEETRRRCLCVPSCSKYAIMSLKKIFPLLSALLKIRKRLYVTCKGEEYIIDFPTKKMGKEFERKL